MQLSDAHLKMLAASGITPQYAQQRGYKTVYTIGELERLNIPIKQRRTPGLLIPGHRKDGSIGHQYRPDKNPPPGIKAMKYVSPVRQRNYIDIPVGSGPLLDNPAVPLWITEGAKKADAAFLRGLMCVSINGVYGWRGTNTQMGKTALGDWDEIALNNRRIILAFDGDVQRKDDVRTALSRLASFLTGRGAQIEYLHLPDTDQKTGLDDYLMHHSVEQLWARVLVSPPGPNISVQVSLPLEAAKTPPQPPQPPQRPAEPVDGTQLFNDIHSYLGQYVVYPAEWAQQAHTLWIGHAWLLDCWESSPRIAFLSPEPGSGKTRALEITEPLVPNPIHSVNVTPAYLFRKIAEDPRPTILYDEIDTVFGPKKDNEDIRALVNSGHRKGATAGRCIIKGKEIVTEELPSYCAIALAGLNDLPDTIATRSVLIRMRKRSSAEPVKPWRARVDTPRAVKLAQQLADWATQQQARAADKTFLENLTMPEGIADRNADIWEALLAVAELAGGDWPRKAAESCVAAVADSMAEEPSLGTALLNDIQQIFDEMDACSVPTSELVHKLRDIEESPWKTYGYHQNGLDTRGLARMLRRYEIRSQNIRFVNGVFKGYYRKQFEDSWTRYQQTPKNLVPHPVPHDPVQVPSDKEGYKEGSVPHDPVQVPSDKEQYKLTSGNDAVQNDGHPVHAVHPSLAETATSATTVTVGDPRQTCWKCLGSKPAEDKLCAACQREENEE